MQASGSEFKSPAPIWKNSAGQWRLTPIIPAPKRQRQANLCDIKASLVYRVSYRTSRATQRNPILKKLPAWLHIPVTNHKNSQATNLAPSSVRPHLKELRWTAAEQGIQHPPLVSVYLDISTWTCISPRTIYTPYSVYHMHTIHNILHIYDITHAHIHSTQQAHTETKVWNKKLGWRDGSNVKSVFSSWRRPKFGF